MAKTIAKVLGAVFVLLGLAGSVRPDFLGAHLSPTHNLIYIVSGAIALYFGFASSTAGARAFALVFGVVYLLLGLVAWFMGTGAEHMFSVGTLLMLGKADHIVHILFGIIFLAGGLLGDPTIPPP